MDKSVNIPNSKIEAEIKKSETIRKSKGQELSVKAVFYRLVKGKGRGRNVDQNLRESDVVYSSIVHPANTYINKNKEGNIQLIEMKVMPVDGVSEGFVPYVIDFLSRVDRPFGNSREYSERRSKAYVNKTISRQYDRISEFMIYAVLGEKSINFPRTQNDLI